MKIPLNIGGNLSSGSEASKFNGFSLRISTICISNISKSELFVNILLIPLSNREQSKSIVNIKDGTKIGASSGKDIMTIFKSFPSQRNIFDSFDYMDQREDYIRSQRDNDPEFNQNFEKFCAAFLNGDDISQFNKQYLAKQTGRKYSAQTANKHQQQRQRQQQDYQQKQQQFEPQPWTNENGKMSRKYTHPIHKMNNNGELYQQTMRPHNGNFNSKRKYSNTQRNNFHKAKQEDFDVEKTTNDHSDSSKSTQGSGEKRKAKEAQLTEV